MEALLELDSNILLWIQEYVRHDFMDWFWTAITKLGDGGIFWIAVSIFLIFFKETRPAGIAALCSIVLCFCITNLTLKPLVDRPRPYTMIPELELIIPRESDRSFPSGHTTASFAAALIFVRMIPKKYGVPAVILATLVALSRLYVGVHYPTDVLGGFLVAMIGSMVVYHFYLYLHNKKISTEQKY